MDSIHLSCARGEVIQPWFDHFQILGIKEIKQENCYNKDKAGIMEGRGTKGLVVGASDHKALQKKQQGDHTWISFIECVSATGRFLQKVGKTLDQNHAELAIAKPQIEALEEELVAVKRTTSKRRKV